MHILVADDDPLFARLASSCLTGAGMTVCLASDGGDALAAMQTGVFDAVLLDLSMPRIDGFRLLAWMRSTPGLQSIPVLVLTARHDVEAIQEAYRIGADGFYTKPVNWALLPIHLRHVSARARTMAAMREEIARLRAALRGTVGDAAPSPASCL